jgi:hypothetical protein
MYLARNGAAKLFVFHAHLFDIVSAPKFGAMAAMDSSAPNGEA